MYDPHVVDSEVAGIRAETIQRQTVTQARPANRYAPVANYLSEVPSSRCQKYIKVTEGTMESVKSSLITLAGARSRPRVADLWAGYELIPGDHVAQGALGCFGDSDSRSCQDTTNAVSIVRDEEVGRRAGQILAVIPLPRNAKGFSQSTGTAG
jgi:hypothetical protein